jgi:hypothetical protein
MTVQTLFFPVFFSHPNLSILFTACLYSYFSCFVHRFETAPILQWNRQLSLHSLGWWHREAWGHNFPLLHSMAGLLSILATDFRTCGWIWEGWGGKSLSRHWHAPMAHHQQMKYSWSKPREQGCLIKLFLVNTMHVLGVPLSHPVKFRYINHFQVI